jgi:H3 lysine-79-specific histone-lysine N-methyltransferase
MLCAESFEDNTVFDIIHGADATSGEYAPKFKTPWDDDYFLTCKLQYPSRSQQELFELKWPKNEAEDYKPMEDIIESIHMICKYYLPADLSAEHTSEETGFRRRFNRAWQRESPEEFIEIVEDFNGILKKLVYDGTIRTEVQNTACMPLEWVNRILEQIYARTVSPKVEKLRAYKNGSDNVYGELLPRFVSDIFKKTNLNHEMTFVDLGSGVGNVVLQAALEVGCESWGIEMMENPCDLAELQEKEFPERTRLWGLKAGKVSLLRGDFTKNEKIGDVLKRADVVLVNNQAFTPQLNDNLLTMFLDLKNGCQVVSLKPFVPDGHKMSTRNVGSVVNLFVQRKFEYFSDNVSWGAASGNWYIARKDPGPLEQFMKIHRLR